MTNTTTCGNILVAENQQLITEKKNRLIRMSRRTAECLGLERGDLVDLGGNKVYVLPQPNGAPLVDGVGYVSKDILSLLPEEESSITPVSSNNMTIGCDPEFLLVDGYGRVKDARVEIGNERALGSDGFLGELRPSPATDARGLLLNLHSLITRIPSKTEYRPVAHSYYKGYMSGFHIHLGLPGALSSCVSKKSVAFVRNLVSVLDYYVGLPAMLLDNDDKRRLSCCEYGRPGDFKITECTVEYRTPGGFLLRHPWYTRSLLETAHLVASDILGRYFLITKAWTRLDKISSYDMVRDMYSVPTKKEVNFLITNRNRKAALDELPEIKSKLSKIRSSRIRSYHFFRALFSPPDKDYSDGLLENWGPYDVRFGRRNR